MAESSSDTAHIEHLITNYQAMIEEVDKLDEKKPNSQIASDFFYTMVKVNLPFVRSYVESLLQSEEDPTTVAELSEFINRIQGLLDKIRHRDKGHTGKEDESPFLLLLRLAVHEGSINFNKPLNDDKWGEMSSFRKYLESIRQKFRFLEERRNAGYWPGLPFCILVHINTDPDGLRWDPVISASKDRYDDFKGHWQDRRHNRMSRLEQNCPRDVTRRIDNLRNISKSFVAWAEKEKYSPTKNYRDSLHSKDRLTGIPVNLPGMLTTWQPNGDYMLSCRLDHFRFYVTKPPEAKRRERRTKDIHRLTYPHESCAEWSGFLEWCALTQAWPTAYKPTRWPPPERSAALIPSWPFRAWDEMPLSPYTKDEVEGRPARYDATNVGGKWDKWFPGLPLRKSVSDKTLFGHPIRTQYASIANLEGAAGGESPLGIEEIVAGLAFSLQDMQDTVWISMLIHLEDFSSTKFDDKTKNIIRTRRFHVWPIHFAHKHWILAIYDREQDLVHWMDSVPDLERMLNFAKKYRKFLHHFNITLYVNDPVSAESVPVPQPHNDWASGFHLIENARVFFREPLGEGSKARSWHESQACKKLRATDSQVSAALYESHMVKKWVDFARLELGHADRAPIRSSGTKLPALAARASK